MTEIRKRTALMSFSWEYLTGPAANAEFYRTHEFVEPTADEFAAFAEWKERMEALRAEGEQWFVDGGPDEGFEYTPPTGKWVKIS